ncbi:MAG: NAD-specific glutamate dehydrogenase [Holosporales bacterium]
MLFVNSPKRKGFNMIKNHAELRKNVINRLISSALYCLNLKDEKEKESVGIFLNAFLGMQGPEFFEQLEKAQNEKSYAGALCDVWHLFQKRTEPIHVEFFDHPFEDGLSFVTILSKDCDYITKTIQHFLNKGKIKYKNLMHPVVQVQRDEDGNLLHIYDGQWASELEDESVVHFLIVQPLSMEERAQFKATIIEAYHELALIFKSKAGIIQKIYEACESYDHASEERTFLETLLSGHYYFYGYRFIKGKQDHHHLGLFQLEKYQTHPFLMAEHLDVLNIYKSALRSNINRASRFDCIEIPCFNAAGEPVGLHQFIGVFTADFFAKSPLDFPVARIKAQNILDQFGLNPRWYNSRLLRTIMDSISLDLFFHLDADEIGNICQRVLEMQRDIVVYLKAQKDDAYILILCFLPSDKYSYTLKETLKKYFEKTLNGQIFSEHVLISDDPFTRIVFVVDRDEKEALPITLTQIEEEVNMLGQTWVEKLEKISDYSRAQRINKIFPSSYKKLYDPHMALLDAYDFQKLNQQDIVFNFHKLPQKSELHIFSKNKSIHISDFLPLLDDFGFSINAQDIYELKDGFLTVFDVAQKTQGEIHHDNFLNTLCLAYNRQTKRDLLNQFVVTTPLTHRDLLMLRSLIKMLKQIGFAYSYEYIVDVFCHHPHFVESFVQCFTFKFDPHQVNEEMFQTLLQDLNAYCLDVTKLDDERILRAVLNLLESAVRTNFYQEKPYISIKYASRKIENLPKPAPLYEIFVYSYSMEGVHLRAGKVARGGIRWSDRFEDFRFEILGLVKAQTVKNSVIVPLGSKGGFVVNDYESLKNNGAAPDVLKNCVVSAYQTFISGLLDITDNLKNDQVVKPLNCICYDEDDPYLVVAADKGTATFSDIANELSKKYDFWLGDAFASGGSKGYDHKKMAITARGAWISVQHHFKEMGVDVQKDPFSVVGVGDMAGDVFGNGMLQSDKIRLVGAFNHEHIFLDPNPDCATSFLERKRLFERAGSKWSDYNLDLISAGGGVYSRSLKSIPLSDAVKKCFNIDYDTVSPDELIKLLLKADVDLLFFGGIGTFVKGAAESNADAKDRVNDLLRIQGAEIKAKVVGEGANLGMTQLARIDYALKGGRVNMDAVDNSAGVDCSDHEVNIKILFNVLQQRGLLSLQERDQMLVDMTDSVADLVLNDNRQQTFLLSQLERSLPLNENDYLTLMHKMEKDSFLPLDVHVEYLPTKNQLNARLGQSFTRPELAIITSYAKLHLYQTLLTSDLNYDSCLVEYFPKLMVARFGDFLSQHPLKKEIVSTFVANYIINRCGIHFVQSIKNTTGHDEITIVKAFLTCVALFDMDALWNTIFAYADLDQQYQGVEKMAHQMRTLVVAYLRCQNALDVLDFDQQKNNLTKIMNAFLDMKFAPLAIYMLARNSCFDCATKNCEKLFDVLDLDYLLELSQLVPSGDVFEAATLSYLTDNMFKTIVKVMCALNRHNSKDLLDVYTIQKNIAKDQPHSVVQIGYMIQQLERLT